jgi:hypothetical protein
MPGISTYTFITHSSCHKTQPVRAIGEGVRTGTNMFVPVDDGAGVAKMWRRWLGCGRIALCFDRMPRHQQPRHQHMIKRGYGVMTEMRSIVARYPERELDIRRLCARESGFRAVCRDYEEAVSALRHWQNVAVAGKVQDYANFLEELEAEILGRLNRSTSRTEQS